MKILHSIIGSWLALVSAMGASFSDSFSSEPKAWRAHNPRAVAWDSTAQSLAVTWDSRLTNSFFYYPLPFALNRTDAFSFELTLKLDDIQIGIDPAKKSTFQMCFGFVDLAQATRANYFRGSGVHPTYGARGLVEFDYFPGSGLIEATVGPVIASTNNQIAYSHSFPVELAPGDTYRIKVAFDPGAQQLNTTILRNGEPYGEPGSNAIRPLYYTSDFRDFRVDAFSIHSYSDAGQNPPQFAGSLLAHGTIDDVVITWPDPPIGALSLRRDGFSWIVSCAAKSGWVYTLERTLDFRSWEYLTSEPGIDGALDLIDADPPGALAFYRVMATR